jgi:hypothetical protein
MTRLQPLRPLAVLLAAGAVAAPAATARPFHHHDLASASIASRDVPGVDARHAALVQRDQRAAAPTSSLAGTARTPADRSHPATSSDGGLDAAPLAGGIAVLAAAFGAGVSLRRRQARAAV